MKRPLSGRWPPPYNVKENARAKRVILRIKPLTGLIVTIPKGYDRGQIPRILDDRRSWIEETLKKECSGKPDLTSPRVLPDKIHLVALEETWTASYLLGKSGVVEIFWDDVPEPHIRFQGDFSNIGVCCRLLRHWLREIAREALHSWVEEISTKTGLSYERIQIRVQKTRLGSLSSRGTLSLNAAVLFLRRELVEHLILHELCHQRHLNHGPGFWNLVAQWQPNFKPLESELKNAGKAFPPWLVASFL